MFHFNYHRLRALLHLNTISEPFASAATPKCYPFLQHKRNPSPTVAFSFFSTTSTPDEESLMVSYLTVKCGFSPEAAIKACKRVHFKTPQKPDSVLAFFRNYGFSETQIHSIIGRVPELLTCDPSKRVLPKFEFLASKGASHCDILLIVTRSPDFMRNSLENHIVPIFELIRKFCPSDKKTIASVVACPTSISDSRVPQNVKMLLHEGFTHSNIYHLLRTRSSILCSSELVKTVEELKQLGFDPSRLNFSIALLAKRAVSKSQWDAKVKVFKTWGWSEEEISDMFKRFPQIMLRSEKKLKAVLAFWIGQLGWDPLTLRVAPIIFGFSLEKRVIPRASVVQYLLSKGLMKKTASLVTPFGMAEKKFLQKYVTCFEENDMTQLLKLYHGEC